MTAHFVVSRRSTTRTTKVWDERLTTKPRRRNQVYNWTNTACPRSSTLPRVHLFYILFVDFALGTVVLPCSHLLLFIIAYLFLFHPFMCKFVFSCISVYLCVPVFLCHLSVCICALMCLCVSVAVSFCRRMSVCLSVCLLVCRRYIY